MGETTLTAEPGIPQIVMTREFDAAPELLLRAYTEPELIEQWWGPRKFATIVDRFDLRHGGEWRFLNRDDDGTEYGFHGVFHGVPSVDGGVVQTWEYEGAPGHSPRDRHVRGARRRHPAGAHRLLPDGRGARRDGRLRHGIRRARDARPARRAGRLADPRQLKAPRAPVTIPGRARARLRRILRLKYLSEENRRR